METRFTYIYVNCNLYHKIISKILETRDQGTPNSVKVGNEIKSGDEKEHRNKFGDEIPFLMSKLIVQKNHICFIFALVVASILLLPKIPIIDFSLLYIYLGFHF